MSDFIKIFGYGSLLNEESIKRTAPSVKNIKPVILYGFVRVFNLPSRKRISEIDGTPCAVLNVEKSEFNERINGVVFEVSEECFEELKERERAYEVVQVEVRDFFNEDSLELAYFFRAMHFEAHPYQEESEQQREYLNICLEGCEVFGDEFLEEFKNTTYIGRKTLKELGF